ncbi:MAG: hypothetical protein NWF05_04110 [Candidatus Bathyarchaeota archaeon]|nr:hypothetical protein [Candidatus Bathyarchaeota archaeon]
MSTGWEDVFRQRIDKFEAPFLDKDYGRPISIKMRVNGGCFCHGHAPYAWREISRELESRYTKNAKFSFEDHETGPELLVYVTFGAAGITLAAGIINLVTAIIKSRSEGVMHGDHPYNSIELIVRGFDDDGKIKQEIVHRFESRDPVDKEFIEASLKTGIRELLSKPPKKNKRKT